MWSQDTKLLSRPLLTGLLTPEYQQQNPSYAGLELCDAVEVRGDLFKADEVIGVCESVALAVAKLGRNEFPIFLTLRLKRDGGQWPDALAAARIPLWMAAASLGTRRGCDTLDLELEYLPEISNALRDAIEEAGMRVVISTHDFTGPFNSVKALNQLQLMSAFQPDGVKFAVTAQSEKEVDAVLKFALEVSQRFTFSGVFAMGGLGQVTRMLSPFLGCPLTYAFFSGPSQKKLAPGQLSVQNLREALDQGRLIWNTPLREYKPALRIEAQKILSRIGLPPTSENQDGHNQENHS